MGVTDDRSDPRLTHGVDEEPRPQAEVYLVLSEQERAMGFVRPFRRAYIHAEALGGCGSVTTMARAIAESYARDPKFYGATFCFSCGKHRPVGEHGEFLWDVPYPPFTTREEMLEWQLARAAEHGAKVGT